VMLHFIWISVPLEGLPGDGSQFDNLPDNPDQKVR
jgi:hypothetical protein